MSCAPALPLASLPGLAHLWYQLLWAGMESFGAPDRPTGSTWGPDGDRFLKKLTTLGKGGGPGEATPTKNKKAHSPAKPHPGASWAALATGSEAQGGGAQGMTPGAAKGRGAEPLELSSSAANFTDNIP